MKIRIKLISVLLIASLIPLYVFSAFSSSKYVENICSAQSLALKNCNSDKAAYINEFMRNLSNSQKSFASDETVRSYVTKCSEEKKIIENDDGEYTRKLLQDSTRKSPVITDMFIMDNSGNVIVANNDSEDMQYADFNELERFSSVNNGISKIYGPSKGNGCYFYIVRRIYSQTNKSVGIVCQKIDMTSISEILKISGFSNNAEMIIVDSDGKYIISNSSNPKSLEAVAEYKNVAANMKDVIPFYGQTNVQDTLSAEFDNYVAYGTVVTVSNWSVIGTLNISGAKSTAKAALSSSNTLLVVLTILTAIAIIAICIVYTNPISKIINVINKKNKGDSNVRLSLNTKDEFGEISSAFNTMVDSIFESEQRYRTVVSMADNVVFEINMKAYTVYVSNNFNQKYSFRPKNDSISESFLYKMKVHKDDAKRYAEDVDKIVSSTGEKWEGEYRLKNIYGDFGWVRIKGRKFYDRNNTPSKITGMLVDIDREKKSTMNLMQKANYDALTQLYNRATFMRTLDNEMLQSVSRKSLDALMFIDLDDFKHFNDKFGHKCGDEVLKFVADTIKELTFDKGFGGRLGGDEFVMCLTKLKFIDDAGNAAAEMINILKNGFISESTGNKFNVHCSIGIAFFRENGSNSSGLLEAADSAMYRIKESGKSNFAYAGREAGTTAASPYELNDPYSIKEGETKDGFRL